VTGVSGKTWLPNTPAGVEGSKTKYVSIECLSLAVGDQDPVLYNVLWALLALNNPPPSMTFIR